jgi:hypothetical protein
MIKEIIPTVDLSHSVYKMKDFFIIIRNEAKLACSEPVEGRRAHKDLGFTGFFSAPTIGLLNVFLLAVTPFSVWLFGMYLAYTNKKGAFGRSSR